MSHSRATLQVKVFAWLPLGNQLFWFRETFKNQVTSSKISGAMVTKMVPTWRVAMVANFLDLNNLS